MLENMLAFLKSILKTSPESNKYSDLYLKDEILELKSTFFKINSLSSVLFKFL